MRKPETKISFPTSLLLVLLAAFLLRFAMQFLFDFPFGFDTFLHMDLAKTFTTPNWFSVNVNTIGAMQCSDFPCPVDDRPPFFNFVTGLFFSVFGQSYEIAKFTNVILGTLMIVPIFLIGRSYGKAGLFASVFIAVSPFFIGQSVDTEVRIITAYAALTSLYFFMSKNLALSFLFLTITFLIHYPESIILGITYLIFLVKSRFRGVITKQNTMAIILSLIIVSPWVVRNYEFFGSPLTSSSSRFVNLNSEYEILLLPGNEPSAQKEISQVIRDKLFIFLRAVFPVPFTGGNFNLNFLSNENMINRSFISFLTLPIAALSMIYLVKAAMRAKRQLDVILVYVIVGFAFAIAVTNIIIPIELSILFPQVALLSVAAFSAFEKIGSKYKKAIAVLIVIFIILQVGNYTLKNDVRRDFAQSWITQNTEIEDKIMLRWTDTYVTNFLTGRSTIAIRYGSQQQFLNFVNESGADYIVVDDTDVFVGSLLNKNLNSSAYTVDLDFLGENFQNVGTYNVYEKGIFKEHKNTYYIFKT
ncbi:MAG: glycosyltransferase family 39 protein [Candidatus Aenigmarchaeota archaeon]|nr:glycosyltransferase family 39 protein [Candidatus Aenigmarchaeota archaeon]